MKLNLQNLQEVGEKAFISAEANIEYWKLATENWSTMIEALEEAKEISDGTHRSEKLFNWRKKFFGEEK